MLHQLEEIRNSESFLANLLAEGEKRIQEVKGSGNLDVRVKGTHASGVEDEISRADTEVRDHYLQAVRSKYPNWSIIMEDAKDSAKFEDIPEWGVVALFDPVDGTKLLIEGKKGYSTMAAAGVKIKGRIVPSLGLIRIVGDEFISAYHNNISQESYSNIARLESLTENAHVLGRTSVERAVPKILSPLTKRLGFETKMIRGIGPNVQALVHGETGVCVYEPGVSFWDIFPAMPIIYAHGGEVFGLDGNEIVYDGKSNQISNGTIMLMTPGDKERVLDASRPLLAKYLSAKK